MALVTTLEWNVFAISPAIFGKSVRSSVLLLTCPSFALWVSRLRKYRCYQACRGQLAVSVYLPPFAGS